MQDAPKADPRGATARITLTDRYLRLLKPGLTARDVWDSEQPGLVARILSSGLVEFATRYRFHGRRRRLKLGTFPAITLNRARALAREAKGEIDVHHDPAAERRAAKAARTDRARARRRICEASRAQVQTLGGRV